MDQSIEVQKRLWEIEQNILDVIHRVCSEQGLRYSIAYGTLIGAVRHGGFIPWDDDIDVTMPREDYDKLMATWDHAAPEGYVLETEGTTDDYVNNFAKIRKDHTTFLLFDYERNEKHHKGIYVDVFPGDRRAPGRLSKKMQFAYFAINLLFSRGYTSGSGGVIEFGERVLLRIVPRRYYKKLSKWAGERSRKWNNCNDLPLVFPSTIVDCRKNYPADLFDQLDTVMFNGKEYPAFGNYDTYLRITYGNYMELPPEEERVWKHHPVFIDFEHNYEELDIK